MATTTACQSLDSMPFSALLMGSGSRGVNWSALGRRTILLGCALVAAESHHGVLERLIGKPNTYIMSCALTVTPSGHENSVTVSKCQCNHITFDIWKAIWDQSKLSLEAGKSKNRWPCNLASMAYFIWPSSNHSDVRFTFLENKISREKPSLQALCHDPQ